MGKQALPGIALAPTSLSSDPHSPLEQAISSAHTTVAQPTRVLICVENAGVRELMRLMLADAGCAVAAMEVWPWLVGDPSLGPPPDVVILPGRFGTLTPCSRPTPGS